MPKPTVVIATGAMNAGGTETLIMEMLRHASGRVRYILLIHHDGKIKPGVFDREINRLGVKVEYIPSVGSLGIMGYLKAFKAFKNRAGKIDIVHSHLNGAGGVIALAARGAGVKHRICHCHANIRFTGGFTSKIKKELALAVMKSLIELYATDRWACSAEAWHRLFFPWHKSVVIHNMIDAGGYTTSKQKRLLAKQKFGLEGKKVVGSVGRVAPIKNYEIILQALVGTDAHFACFGRFDPENPYCSSLINLAKSLGISERVHWLGNSNNLTEDIHCIDLFVMPSFTEGFGMAALEAQAASIPSVLSSGVPAIVDLGLGLVTFAASDDVDAWHKAIVDFRPSEPIPHDKILEKFRTKGFDSPSGVKDIENQYLSIIQS